LNLESSFDADVKARLTRIENMLSAIIPTTDETSYRTQARLAQGESDHAQQSNVQTRGSRAPAFGIRPAMEGIMSAGEEVFHPDRKGGDMDVDMDFVSPSLGNSLPRLVISLGN
jgi:hypothetical protein